MEHNHEQNRGNTDAERTLVIEPGLHEGLDVLDL
jgi:hypothetical protein